MKTSKISSDRFVPVSDADAITIEGGGFAYDVGLFLRYLSFGGNPYRSGYGTAEYLILLQLNKE